MNVAQLLVTAGVDVNARDNSVSTPLVGSSHLLKEMMLACPERYCMDRLRQRSDASWLLEISGTIELLSGTQSP